MTTSEPSEISQPPLARIDDTVPHSARVWNYWLGGKDNYQVDRAVGEQVAEVFPAIRDSARASRAYLGRAIRYLAGEAGIRQFLDVGTGLPTADNTHEVAQSVAPQARIVYVDNDPLVLVHARALLTSSREGASDYVDADMRDTDRIVAQASRTLDFAQPIALIMNGIIGHVGDDEEAHSIVHRLVGSLPAGSYLSMSDGANTSDEGVRSTEPYRDSGAVPYYMRSPSAFAAFFDGLELVEPGVVPREEWRPDAPRPSGSRLPNLAAVGRKP